MNSPTVSLFQEILVFFPDLGLGGSKRGSQPGKFKETNPLWIVWAEGWRFLKPHPGLSLSDQLWVKTLYWLPWASSLLTIGTVPNDQVSFPPRFFLSFPPSYCWQSVSNIIFVPWSPYPAWVNPLFPSSPICMLMTLRPIVPACSFFQSQLKQYLRWPAKSQFMQVALQSLLAAPPVILTSGIWSCTATLLLSVPVLFECPIDRWHSPTQTEASHCPIERWSWVSFLLTQWITSLCNMFSKIDGKVLLSTAGSNSYFCPWYCNIPPISKTTAHCARFGTTYTKKLQLIDHSSSASQ